METEYYADEPGFFWTWIRSTCWIVIIGLCCFLSFWAGNTIAIDDIKDAKDRGHKAGYIEAYGDWKANCLECLALKKFPELKGESK